MADLVLAVDQGTLNRIIAAEEKDLIFGPKSSTKQFGPFFITASASAKVPHGTLSLSPPNVFRLINFELDYTLSLSFGVNLDDILPSFCLPQVCVFGWCTPKICISWGSISVPVSTSGSVTTTADLLLDINLDNNNKWNIDIILRDIPQLDLSAQAAALLGVIQAAVELALLAVPFIGPFLSLAVGIIMAAFDVAALAGWLGDLLTVFLSGLCINLAKHDKVVKLLDAGTGGQYPEVDLSLDGLTGTVAQSDKTELVLTGTLSFP